MDGTKMMPKICNPIGIDAEGHPKAITSTEAVLNWQFENALAHNRLLRKIKHKVDIVNTNMTYMASSFSTKVHGLEAIVQDLQRKIDALHHLLQTQAIQYRLDPQKEQKLRTLKK